MANYSSTAAELERKVESEVQKIGTLVKRRMREFRRLGREGRTHFDFRPFLDVEYDAGIFSELCFCILTANSTAKRGIEIQSRLGDDGFLRLPLEKLTNELKLAGHRFPPTRAKFIVEARKFSNIKDVMDGFKDVFEAREWLVNNVKGLGWKEASHFLRNTGHEEVSILDRHVCSVMDEYCMIQKKWRTLTRRRYLEGERLLETVSKRLDIPPGELDLYLWYFKAGKVLK
ncbi:MAG: N-glycosylase/DNA lyase [Candidatus Hadarchaeota archaeon]